MNTSENFGSSWSTRTMAALSSRMMRLSVIVATAARRRGWPVRQPSPKKSPFAGEKRCDIEGRLAVCLHENSSHPIELELFVLKTRCGRGHAFSLSSSVPAEDAQLGL